MYKYIKILMYYNNIILKVFILICFSLYNIDFYEMVKFFSFRVELSFILILSFVWKIRTASISLLFFICYININFFKNIKYFFLILQLEIFVM